MPEDPAADVVERAGNRLRAELVALFEQIGADFRATYRLDLPDEHGQPEDGDLEDVVFDLVWATKRALSVDEHDVTSTDPAGGQVAVGLLVSMLRPRLDELGVLPNPLAAYDDAQALLDVAGGDDAWETTASADRPLLIVRRVVRCHLDPGLPTDIYREWWS
ncbi:hypothetical protein [Actinomycetospora soli]|uniref:hypothetical protein n=1 Tax=Actinomycetospora soli TaxID=2893887 RepID=UPI001E467197|nr:hypothetical protein [Actinomycetospora soli]MCD2191375.1 hypothetical protein [Actinomycetospora soli]